MQEQPVLLERGLFQLDCTSFLRDLRGRLDGMTQEVMRAIEARIMEDCAKLRAVYEGATDDLLPAREAPAEGSDGSAAPEAEGEGKEGGDDGQRLAELADALAKKEEEMKRVEEELANKQDGYRELAMFVFSEPDYVMSAKATQVLTTTLSTGAEARESMKRASVRYRGVEKSLQLTPPPHQSTLMKSKYRFVEELRQREDGVEGMLECAFMDLAHLLRQGHNGFSRPRSEACLAMSQRLSDVCGVRQPCAVGRCGAPADALAARNGRTLRTRSSR